MNSNIEKIPLRLRLENFGFVKLKGKTKIPFEKDWQNKPYSFTDILKHIEEGNNYGVLGGVGDLIIIDADTEIISSIVEEQFPATFTIKTNKGFHFYYLCKGLDKKIVLKQEGIHYGEIISTGSQVVGPNSIHPDTGNLYAVFKDIDIVMLDKEEIFKRFDKYLQNEKFLESEFISKFSEIVKEYGEPYYLSKEGILTSLNQSFWAGLSLAENIQLYEPNEKMFYRYKSQSGLFIEITEDIIKQHISKRILEVSRTNNIPLLERKRTISTLNNIVSHLKGIAEHKDAFGYKNKDFIHLKNGVLQIHGDKIIDLVDFSPKFRSRNQSPIEFNPEARCDKFLDELLRPSLSEEDIILIQKYAGLCLLGDNLIQRFLILGGEAGQGKSQLSIVLQELVGLQNVTELRTQHLRERFELYRYRKKTLLVGVDVTANFLEKRGAYVLKGLTGGDSFDTEKKNSTESFPIRGNYCIVITANSKLHIRLEGDVKAWKRRLLIIEYNIVSQKKKIPNFGKLLIKEEGSGILNWALKGLEMIWEDIEKSGDIILGEVQKDRIDALLAESDSLRIFLKDELIKKDGEDLTTTEIEEAYADFCPKKGWNPKHITVIRKELESLMLELFSRTKAHSIMREGKNLRGFRGVTFKNGGNDEY